MRCPRLASVRPVGSIRVLVSVFQPYLYKEADSSWHKSLSSHYSHQMGRKNTHTAFLGVPTPKHHHHFPFCPST